LKTTGIRIPVSAGTGLDNSQITIYISRLSFVVLAKEQRIAKRQEIQKDRQTKK